MPISLAGALSLAVAALLVAVVPPPRLVPVRHPALAPDNGRAEIDSVRLQAAMKRVAPAPAWPGHGGTT